MIRPATPADLPRVLELVALLADFEQLPGPDAGALARYQADLFGPRPRAEILVAERAGQVVAYALFFFTYSTFRARPSLYLEDLFVDPAARGQGVGSALMAALEARALAEGCVRFEWMVLDWNAPAIAFYQRLGARLLPGWRLCRRDLAAP
jgi:GNAT superfamily N-acetyltransferase